LLKYIEEFEKYVVISGFRNVKIKNVEEFLKKINKEKLSNVEIQFFDARFVATWQHLYFAALNALAAFKNQENISKRLSMETMLYASGQRQIKRSMRLFGIKPDMSEIAVLIIGEKVDAVKSALSTVSACINAQHDEMILELSEEKMKTIQDAFEISDLELKAVMKKGDLKRALIDLVIEWMALLATQR